MLIRLPDGRIVPGTIHHGWTALTLTHVEDPKTGERRAPTQEELERWYRDTVTWTDFDNRGRIIAKGENFLDEVEALYEIACCGNCGLSYLGIKDDFLCVKCRYPNG